MNHSFDIDIAKKYGIEEAILLQHLYFWIEKNRANNKHFYNDTYWTYNTKKAFTDLFPYMTPRKIDYTLKKLEENKLIQTGNFNVDGRDRTLWYALTKMGYCILQNCNLQSTKLSNDIDTTIINTFNNTDNKQHISSNNNIIINNNDNDNIKINKEYGLEGIFAYWNTKGIIKHNKINELMKKAYKKALKEYSLTDEQIIKAIDNYVIMLNDPRCWINRKWSLDKFLSQSNLCVNFSDEGSWWNDYISPKRIKQGLVNAEIVRPKRDDNDII